jgi:hypothetical protein
MKRIITTTYSAFIDATTNAMKARARTRRDIFAKKKIEVG